MEITIDYLPYIDIAGLILAILLVYKANRLDKPIRISSKKTNAGARLKDRHVEKAI